MKKITIIQNEEWYKGLVEEIRAIFDKAFFNSRQELIIGYHEVGKAILEHEGKSANLCKTLAESLGKSERTIYYAVQFAKEYPDLDKLPEGKNISMNKIITKYLTKPKKEHVCDFEEITIKKCKLCGKKTGTTN